MQKYFLILTMAAALLVFVSPSFAAEPAPDENGQKLKTLFENFLKDQKDLSDKSGGARFIYDGDVMVEKAESYYAVTLPHVKVSYPDGSGVDIGMISVNASAHETGQWKMAVAIPTPILLTDTAGSAPVKINIGAQKAAGIWDESLEGFAKLDARYTNISINQPEAPYTLSIPDAQIVYDYAKNADGTWSGPGFVAARNLAVQWPANNAGLKLGEIKGEVNLERYNPAAVTEYRNQVMTAQAQNGAIAPSQIFDHLGKLLVSMGGSIKSGFAISNLEVTQPSAAADQPSTIRLASGTIAIMTREFSGEKAGLDLQLSFNGLETLPVPKGYDGVLPESMNINASLNNMPIKALVDLGRATMEATAQNPEMSQLAGMSFMMKAPALFSAAGTSLEIKDTHIGNKDYRYTLSGAAKADINAISFATAELNGEFSGLDQLLERVNAVAADQTHPMALHAKTLADTLTPMKNQGTVKPGTQSAPIYTYHFVLDAKGQALLNGKSLFGAPAAADEQKPDNQKPAPIPGP